MRQSVNSLDHCIHSYDALEQDIRKDLDSTMLSYREISAIVGWSHTQVWSFHKQGCKLQFEVLERLALLFERQFLLTNVTARGQNPSVSVEQLVEQVRLSVTEALKHGISYRKIGRITNISHEWVRCFHVKEASIDVRKLIAIADYLGVHYELSNEKELGRQRFKRM